MIDTLVIIQDEKCLSQVEIILSNSPVFKNYQACKSLFEAKILIKKSNFDILILEINQGFNINWIKNNCKNNIGLIILNQSDIFENQFLDLQLSGYINAKDIEGLLSSSLKRARKRIIEEKNSKFHLNNLHKIVSQKANVKMALIVDGVTEIVNSGDIISISTKKNYCEVNIRSGQMLRVKKTLSEFELLLQKLNFFRIHPSHIINISHLKEYSKENGGTVKMSDSSSLSISANKRLALKKEINKTNLS